MLRQFRYMVWAAVVGFASQGGAVSVAPAGEPCGACHGGPTHIKHVPPTYIRIRWVPVYEDGHVRLVRRAYRVQVPVPANHSDPAYTTRANGTYVPTNPASETPTSRDLPVSGSAPAGLVPPSPLPPGQVSPGPVPPGPASPGAPAGPATADPKAQDRVVLANRAQALLQARCVRC